MNDEDLPRTALDMARQFDVPQYEVALLDQTRHQAVADMLPSRPEGEAYGSHTAAEVARATPTDSSETNPGPVSRTDTTQPLAPHRSLAFPSGATSLPVRSNLQAELSSTLQQQVETKVRVERELKIQIEDNIEQLAQRTGDYLASQLDQREQQLLERIAQQINQQPTRRASLSGPSTTVGG